MEQEIEVTIGKDGKLEVDMHGFTGEACEKTLNELMSKLGTVVNSEKKPEYYQVKNQNKQELGGGW